MSDLYDQDEEMSEAGSPCQRDDESQSGSDDEMTDLIQDMPESIQANALNRVIEQVHYFVTSQLSPIEDLHARAVAMRSFAQSLPTTLSEEELFELNEEMEHALAPDNNLQPYREILCVFDGSLPPPVGHEHITAYQALIRNLAVAIASMTDLVEITDAIGSFAPSIPNVGWDMEFRLQFELEWHLGSHPDKGIICLIFLQLTTEEEAVLYFDDLPEGVREKILLYRPDIVWNFFDDDVFDTPENDSDLFWFYPQHAKPHTAEAYLEPGIEGAAAANELLDLLFISLRLDARFDKMIGIFESEDNYSLKIPQSLQSFMGNKVNDVLDAVREHAKSPKTVQLPDTQDFADGFRYALKEYAAGVARAEDRIMEWEANWTTNPDKQFKASASRLMRAVWQHDFKLTIAGLKTESLRQSEPLYTDNVLRRQPSDLVTLSVRLHAEDDTECPICSEEWDVKEGKTPIPPIVTPCCKKPFHSSCLMSWFYADDTTADEADEADEKTCPYCRARADETFRSELLEWQVKEMDAE